MIFHGFIQFFEMNICRQHTQSITRIRVHARKSALAATNLRTKTCLYHTNMLDSEFSKVASK